ncbi:hypothetical protein SAMN05192541_109238 [Bradyrhizobium arachidis]|nr:hypothetical protein SAMN05192541_109238 [Bradyrhizobium arachidis]
MKGPGVCIFCGRVAGTKDGSVTVSMSRQHLWPKWMQTPFPKTNDTHVQSRLRHNLLPGKGVELRPYEKVHQGDIKTRQLRIVCEYHCNNGWISRAENQTKEFLIPLINGEFFTLTEEAQQKFALWLAIACTVFEYSDDSTRAIPEADRKYIHGLRQAPPQWSMWIGNYRGTEWQTRYRHHGAHAVTRELFSTDYLAAGPHPPNHQVSSLQIGELFMHVTSSTVASIWQFDHANDPPGMMRLWPVRGPIQWPNLFTLDDAAVNSIADRLIASAMDNLKTVDW